jgi:hypothetical protein
MGNKIRITAAEVETTAELNDTGTAQAIWQALPITGHVNLWGDEIYFSIPVKLKSEAGQEVVSIGYWPDGSAFCIFFGPTPVSQRHEIRAASPVTVFGKVIGDAAIFKKVAPRTKITIKGSE